MAGVAIDMAVSRSSPLEFIKQSGADVSGIGQIGRVDC